MHGNGRIQTFEGCIRLGPFLFIIWGSQFILKLPQIGDVVVLDISATKIDKDESKVQNIPAAESKGLPICTKAYVW